ncbi:glutamate mutase L [Arsenicicoccus piscis]|uniref:glutamate mutase L n=1 Tax=Arsenicicoccus piscis TaxID=673954 RepID=UPI001F4CFF7C|nr:glutamate mutase L [Arsenicicoccus piscis]
MQRVLAVDVGSTWTKGVLVDPSTGAVLACVSEPTTSATDVLEGLDAVVASAGAAGGGASGDTSIADPLVCSSAGGGLRLAVVGHEPLVTAEAGRRVGLCSGAKVVSVTGGPLDPAGVRELRATRPDIVLLVGGTDGSNSEVLLHNAFALARARITAPVVVAGNAHAARQVGEALAATGRVYQVVANVLPRIGVIAAEPAREAIREAFVQHVIGGKGLSRGRRFGQLVRAATPDAVLRGVQVLAEVAGCDVLVVDVGGATTDVYSVIEPSGEDATLRKEVVAPLWSMRTVEGDLGLRWSAATVLDAARAEAVELAAPGVGAWALADWAEQVAAEPGRLPASADERACDRELARACAVVAVRRHARPDRPLADVGLVVGSGGALRHGPDGLGEAVLGAVLSDTAGGWRLPRAARAVVDRDYRLAAVGLLADVDAAAARRVAAGLLG